MVLTFSRNTEDHSKQLVVVPKMDPPTNSVSNSPGRVHESILYTPRDDIGSVTFTSTTSVWGCRVEEGKYRQIRTDSINGRDYESQEWIFLT